MVYFIKQIKSVYNLFLMNKLSAWGGETINHMKQQVDKATVGSFTSDEIKDLIRNNIDDAEQLKKYINEKRAEGASFSLDALNLIMDWKNSVKDVTNEAKEKRKVLKSDTVETNNTLLGTEKMFLSMDKAFGWYEKLSWKSNIKSIQIILLKAKYNLWKFWPKKDWVDGFKGSATEVAYHDFLSKINTKINTAQTVIRSDFQETESNVKTQVEKNFDETNQKILNFDVNLDIINEKKVTELQELLKEKKYLWEEWKELKIDWTWWKNTKHALKTFIKELQVKTIVPQTEKIVKWSDNSDALSQIEVTSKSIEDLKIKLEITSQLNKQLEDYNWKQNEWYSISVLIQKLIGKDKYSTIDFSENELTKKKIETLLKETWNKDKLERAIKYLVWPTTSNNEKSKQLKNEQIFDETIKVLPWLFGIYLWDIPLAFIKKITKWADINKSVSLTKWIDWWMKWEFSKYYKEDTETDVIQQQYTLRWILTTLKLSDEEKSIALSGDLNKLSNQTKDLLETYIQIRLVPDLKVMYDWSFNWFEKSWLLNIFTDKKALKIEKLLKEIEETNNTSENDLELAGQILELIRKEDDVKEVVINPTEERNEYMWEVLTQNQVFDSISWLSNMWAEYQNFSILFFTEQINWIKNFWLTEADFSLLNTVYSFIKNKNINWLNILLKENPEINQIIKNLWTKNHKTYLLSQIDTSKKLKYVPVWKAKHWERIDWKDNEKDYKIATERTPEDWSRISSLDFGYKSFVDKWENIWITNLEYHESFKNKEIISTEDFKNETIINTGRKEEQETLTNFIKLWDSKIFRWCPIEKKYSFFVNWQKITEKVSYNVYMRPDCQNPLIIPASIETTQTSSTNKFNPETFITVDWKLSIIIPYFLIAKWSGGWTSSVWWWTTTHTGWETINGPITDVIPTISNWTPTSITTVGTIVGL